MPDLQTWPPVLQALVAGLFTWGVTAAAASAVLFTRRLQQRFFDLMLGDDPGPVAEDAHNLTPPVTIGAPP